MFLFNRSTSNEEKKDEPEMVVEDIVVQPIYIVTNNGKTVIYKKEKLEAKEVLKSLVSQKQFELTCELKNVFTEWDESEEVCRIFSKMNNCLSIYHQLEYLLKVERVVNL